MDANDELRGRQIKDAGPWCWQEKDTLQMITDTFSESDQAASARSLYVALTELASDNGSETFTARKALIAHRAGLSISTTERLLKGFEQLHLVAITRNRLGAFKQPNTYTLLAMRNGDASMRIKRPRSNPDRVKELIKKKKNLISKSWITPHPPLRATGNQIFVLKIIKIRTCPRSNT